MKNEEARKFLRDYVFDKSRVGTARCAVRARKAGARIPVDLPPGMDVTVISVNDLVSIFENKT